MAKRRSRRGAFTGRRLSSRPKSVTPDTKRSLLHAFEMAYGEYALRNVRGSRDVALEAMSAARSAGVSERQLVEVAADIVYQDSGVDVVDEYGTIWFREVYT